MIVVLQVVFQIILGLTSLLLTMLILLHKGRGGGLSDMFWGWRDLEPRFIWRRRTQPQPNHDHVGGHLT